MNHKVKIKESKKRDKYLDLVRELKMLWNMKVTVIPIVVGALGAIPKGLIKGLEIRLENKRTSRDTRDHQDYSIIKISQNTKHNPEDLRRLAVTQIQVRNHNPTLVWKSLQEVK